MARETVKNASPAATLRKAACEVERLQRLVQAKQLRARELEKAIGALKAEQKTTAVRAVLDESTEGKARVEELRQLEVQAVEEQTRNLSELDAAAEALAHRQREHESLLKAQENEEQRRLRERLAEGREERRKKLVELLTWIFAERGMRYGVPAFNAGDVVTHELGDLWMKPGNAAVQLREQLLVEIRKEMER